MKHSGTIELRDPFLSNLFKRYPHTDILEITIRKIKDGEFEFFVHPNEK